MTTFTIQEDGFAIDSIVHEHISFIDICAGTSERLEHWRTAMKNILTPQKIQASLAIDIEPKDSNVIEADVLRFLVGLPNESVHHIHGDFWFDYNSSSSDRGFSAILYEANRVLTKEGIFTSVLQLEHAQSLNAAATQCNFVIEPVRFHLGTEDNATVPSSMHGLPPIEIATQSIRFKLQAALRANTQSGVLAALDCLLNRNVDLRLVEYVLTKCK